MKMDIVSLVALNQSGTEFDEEFYWAANSIDGFIMMSGFTYGSWAAAEKGGSDFVAMSMDADGNMLWKYQVGSQEGSRRIFPT